MESVHLIAEEWSSLSGQYTSEESDFMSEFLGSNSNYSVCGNGNTNFGMPTSLWPTHESTILTVTETNTNGTYSFDHATNIDSLSMLFCLGDSFQCDQNLSIQINDCIDEGSDLEPVKLFLADNNNLQAKREHEMMVSEENITKNIENPAKRLRSSIEVSKNMRNVRKCKKSDYVNSNNEEDLQGNGSSNCFSQVDSNVYVELNGGTCNSSLIPKEPQAPNLCRKSRATSGPATDAQSIYARRRRERINERLKILQTLVPNGTKVDISTMLEEAVEYVKFLQLQIKLLSSDDTWMYAPIAYNGMNIGLDINYTSPTKGR